MDIVGFALWKFRTVEGVLKGMHPYDFGTTRYDGQDGRTMWLRYDYERETVEVEESGKKMTCPMTGFDETLRMIGIYHPLPMSERHSCTVTSDE